MTTNSSTLVEKLQTVDAATLKQLLEQEAVKP